MLLTDSINKTNCLKLTKAQALKIELALNLSEYGKTWSKIGDHLYNFCVGKIDNDLYVTTEQYETLVSYLNKK